MTNATKRLENFNLILSNKGSNIRFSKEGILEFINSYQGKFFNHLSEYVPQNVYLILNDSIPVGLIEFYIFEEEQELLLEAIEFPEENQRQGYGYDTIYALQTIFPTYTITGYSGPDEDVCKFLISIGAEYLSCEELCEYYPAEGCDFGCDEPFDYQFKIDDLS